MVNAVFQSVNKRLRTVRRSLRIRQIFILCSIIAVISFVGLITQTDQSAAIISQPVAAQPIKTPTNLTANVSAAQPVTTVQQQSVPKTAAIVQPPSASPCVPTSYSLPSELNLSNQANGLTKVIDPVMQYHIYGNTAPEIRQQIQSCAPKTNANAALAEYTGQTGYQATWRYDIATMGNGTCNLSNAKIGMHIGIVAPYWHASPDAVHGISTSWQNFITSLMTHEQGHVQLSEQYALQMLRDLESYPSSSCSTLQTSVNAIMQNDINSLNIANDQYDSSTNHGATQGAVLPN